MNYCRKCQSDYEKPGTCNCFAPQQAAPAYPWPYTPYIPYSPVWITPYQPYSVTPITLGATVTGGDLGPDATSGSISLESAMRASSGVSFTATRGNCQA